MLLEGKVQDKFADYGFVLFFLHSYMLFSVPDCQPVCRQWEDFRHWVLLGSWNKSNGIEYIGTGVIERKVGESRWKVKINFKMMDGWHMGGI